MVWTVLRYVVLLLVVANFSLAFAKWERWNCWRRECWMPVVAILSLALAIGYASVETLVEHAPGGFRVIIYVAALSVPLLFLLSIDHRSAGQPVPALRGVRAARGRDREHRRRGGPGGQPAVRALRGLDVGLPLVGAGGRLPVRRAPRVCAARAARAGVVSDAPGLSEAVNEAAGRWLAEHGGGMVTGVWFVMNYVDAETGGQDWAWATAGDQTLERSMGLVMWSDGLLRYEQRRYLDGLADGD
jgi:hypothetical protein